MYEKWHEQKQDIHNNKKRPFVHEREIWMASLGTNIGHEQNGTGDHFLRPVIVLQSFGKICFVVPCTTQAKTTHHAFRVGDIQGRKNIALLSQARTIDVKRCIYKKGKLERWIFINLLEAFTNTNVTLLSRRQEGGPKALDKHQEVLYKPILPKSLKKSNTPFEVLALPSFSDTRGNTIPVEFDENFPFVPKRMYFVTGNKGETRGGHAHKVEEEVFIAVAGTITAVVHDGKDEHKILLDTNTKGLLVRTGCWHEFHNFSEDAVLLCLSSTHYMPGEENYIMDKEVFLRGF